MIDYKGLKVLIFDFGGVLINLNRNRSVLEFERLGIKNAENLLSNYVQAGIFLQLESGLIEPDEFHQRLRLDYNLPNLTDKTIDDAFFAFLEHVPAHRLELIRELKKGVYNDQGERLRIVLLSNTNAIHFPACRSTFFETNGFTLSDYFDHLYLSYEMKMSKPDENIFLSLLDSEGVRADQCLFFDDGEVNIKTAARLGFRTQWVTDDITTYFY